MEIVTEAFDELIGETSVGVGIDLADEFFGMPRCFELTAGVTGGEQTHQFGAALDGESLIGSPSVNIG